MDHFEQGQLNKELRAESPERAIVKGFSDTKSIKDIFHAYIEYGIVLDQNPQNSNDLYESTTDMRTRALERQLNQLLNTDFQPDNNEHKEMQSDMRMLLTAIAQEKFASVLSEEENGLLLEMVKWFGYDSTEDFLQKSSDQPNNQKPGFFGLF